MVVAVGELDLQLDPREERRGRVEDEAVRAGGEAVREPGAPVAVRLRDRHRAVRSRELDRDAGGGPSRAGVEHVRREGTAHAWPFQ